MLRESLVHARFSQRGHLLAAPERPHGAVFLQGHGVLRGADLPAVVEGEKKNEDVCGHALTFCHSFAAASSASGKSGVRYRKNNVSVVSDRYRQARV